MKRVKLFEGKSRGYGYVNFKEASSVEEVLKMTGEELWPQDQGGKVCKKGEQGQVQR